MLINKIFIFKFQFKSEETSYSPKKSGSLTLPQFFQLTLTIDIEP